VYKRQRGLGDVYKRQPLKYRSVLMKATTSGFLIM
jgi:hypothetical protein